VKILIIGSGGREHALAWRLAQSPSVKGLIASPGNPGIAQLAQCVPGPISVDGYAAIAADYAVDLTVVGPEAPLVEGIVDRFRQRGLAIIGPTQAAAQLEGSKIFAKRFFEAVGIPTARAITVASYEDARSALKSFSFPLVVKADGLAAGKGVIIAANQHEADQAIERLGPQLVIEEFLEGEEFSFIGLSNGSAVLPFAPAQDHKRAFDGDTGPNTGGMGAYTHPNLLPAAEIGRIMDTVMLPAIAGMRNLGTPFTGFLYAGLMLTCDGPKVLEFNVRLGDPETQVLMQAFRGDFAEFLSMAASDSQPGSVRIAPSACSACVVLAALGYPDSPRTGDEITGIDTAESTGAKVFHAGTKLDGKRLLTSGGRVLGVTAQADSLRSAIDAAYRGVSKIHFDDMHFRRDIGKKGLARL
jgi:phosphoribosylamine--glycine ligase